jgi:MFS family permease
MKSSQSTYDSRILRHSRIAISVLFFVNGSALGSWVTRIADQQVALGLDSAALGWALLAMAIGAMCTMPFIGWCTRRVGLVWVTLVTSMVFCTALALPGWAISLYTLVLALFLFGACNGAMDVAMNAAAAQLEKCYGRTIMPAFHGFFSLGGAAGAVVGGWFAAGAIAPGVHLNSMAALLLVMTAIAAGFVHVPEPVVATTTAPSEHTKDGKSSVGIAVLGIIAAAVMLGEGAVADWSAVFMKTALQANAFSIASAYAAFSTAMALGRLGGNGVVQRLGELRTLRYGTLTAALGLGLVIMAPSPWVAIVGFGCVGLGYSCVFPCVVTAAGRIPHLSASSAIGRVTTLGYGGFLLGPPLIGAIAQASSLRVGLCLVLLLTAVASAMCSRLPR